MMLEAVPAAQSVQAEMAGAPKALEYEPAGQKRHVAADEAPTLAE